MSLSRRRTNALVFGLAIPLGATLLAVKTIGASPSGDQQDAAWIAPPAARTVKNPVRPTQQGLKEAGELFEQVCASCHGPKGAGDGTLGKVLTPKPANFTDAKRMNRATDGELFWKMTNGRGPMPSWQQLPETQRWELVNYIRTLARRANAPEKTDSETK
jgi:mono/diheme cytochrome c family protein